MIVPMKKTYVIVYKNDSSKAVESLREMGILHVENLEAAPAGSLEQIHQDIQRLTSSIAVLKPFMDAKQENVFHWHEKTEEILTLASQITAHRESLHHRMQLINQLVVWGNFDPRDIDELAERGIYITLCEISDRSQIPQGVAAEKISEEKKLGRYAIFSFNKPELLCPEFHYPSMSLNELKSLQDKERKEMIGKESQLKSFAKYVTGFEKILHEESESLRLREVVCGMRQEDTVNLLKGFVPADQIQVLEKYAKKEQWGLLIEDPTGEDVVPTCVKNPKWIEIIKPMFSIMNIVPGYKEKDISVFFLIFFSIFFGILVGDAGYGGLFLLITVIAHKTTGSKIEDKSIFYLSYLLSTVTIVWGLLTGTFFGTLLFGKVFKPLLPWLTDPKNVQFLCFTLGVIHLSIAHIWRALTRGTVFGGLAEVGWILMLWGSYFLANMMLLGYAMPWFVKYLYLAGAIFVIADIVAQRTDIGVNMILFVFSVINTFGDIVSYIRLFAVGLAGVAVADAFNQMALGIGFSNIFVGVGAVLVLAFVHLFLNLALCVMGVLVHGVRLNVLEFSGHLGMEWSGIKYNPLTRLKINQ